MGILDDLKTLQEKLREHSYEPEFPPVSPAALEQWMREHPDEYDPEIGPRWSDVARAAGAVTYSPRAWESPRPTWWGVPDAPVRTRDPEAD